MEGKLVSQDRALRVSICTAKDHTCDGDLSGKRRSSACIWRKGLIPQKSTMVTRIAMTFGATLHGHHRPVVSRHCRDCAIAFLRPSVVVLKVPEPMPDSGTTNSPRAERGISA